MMNKHAGNEQSTGGEQYSFCFYSDLLHEERQEQKRKKAQDLERRIHERTFLLTQTVEALRQEIANGERERQQTQSEMLNRVIEVEEQRERERQLIMQNRLAAMGEMVNNIAHQWRQPLNTLGLYIQQVPIMFKLGEGTEEYVSEVADKCMSIIHHMSRTIDDFRNYFKQSTETSVFHAGDIVNKALTIIEGSFTQRDIRVTVNVVSDVEMTGCPGEFTQVILNILLNARDQFMERNVELPEVSIIVDSSNNRSVLIISDNAGGIDEEILPKIFDPYFTTKGPDRGTGIGLFMSKVIVERNMNGTIHARNNGRGADFIIEV